MNFNLIIGLLKIFAINIIINLAESTTNAEKSSPPQAAKNPDNTTSSEENKNEPTSGEKSRSTSPGRDIESPTNEPKQQEKEKEEAAAKSSEEQQRTDSSRESTPPIDIEKLQENMDKQIVHSLISLLMKVSLKVN